MTRDEYEKAATRLCRGCREGVQPYRFPGGTFGHLTDVGSGLYVQCEASDYHIAARRLGLLTAYDEEKEAR